MKHYLKIIAICIITFVMAIALNVFLPNPISLIIRIIKLLSGFLFAQVEILLYHSKRLQFSNAVFNKYSILIAVIALSVEIMLMIFIIIKRKQIFIYIKQRLESWKKCIGKIRFANPYFKLTGIFLICFLIIVNCYEFSLRYSGFYPGMGFGYVTSNGFRHVDSLFTLQYQIADSEGMACFDVQFPFYVDSLRRINKQGFLSAFDYDRQTVDSLRSKSKKIVFVIGDSFVEGVSDGGANTTFIELMRKNQSKYAIFSFGVRGMDPLNYWLTVKRFVPKLHPDLVVVSFCGQNDFMQYERKLTPGLPLLLHGNAGELTSNIPFNMVGTRDSFLHSYKEAYEFYLSQSSLWGRGERGMVAKICRRSSILTRIYYMFHSTTVHTFNDTFLSSPENSMVTYNYLHSIDSLCQQDSVLCRVAFIPQGNMIVTGKESNYELNYKKRLGDVFFKTKFPHGFIYSRDYIVPEGHFNVSGNQRFATYLLDSVIAPVFQ